MNLGQMKTKLRSRIGNPTTGDVSDVKLTELLNDALEEIRDKYKFRRGRGRAKFTTTIGVGKYKISSITDTVLQVWDRTNNKRLTYAGIRHTAETDNTGATNAKPQYWMRFEDYLQLEPCPDGAYSIELFYRSKVVALAADGDSPDIPSTWHKGIVILAAFNYYDGEAKDLPKAAYEKTAFKDWVFDKPVEVDEETMVTDSGVELPTQSGSAALRQDFDSSP